MTNRFQFSGPRDLARCLLPYGGPAEDPAAPAGGGKAGVALALRGAETGDPELLFIKRAQRGSDPWSGHMALPGGRWEPGDPSLLSTAVRETLEETGVRLREEDGFLGCLPAVEPGSPHLPAITIVPFVFHLTGGAEAEPRSPEVAGTYWVRLGRFREREARASIRLVRSGTEYRFPAVRTPSDEPVWGITYRIVMGFLERVDGEKET